MMDFLLCLLAAFIGFPLAGAVTHPVRLASGLGKCAGRVEVYYRLQWGTVCDDEWDMKDAQVVCRQLGCGKAIRSPRGAFFGHGPTKIWLDNVNCKGTEKYLWQCQHPGWGKHNCGHDEEASVVCSAATAYLEEVTTHFPSQKNVESDEIVPLQSAVSSQAATTYLEEVTTHFPSQKNVESDEIVPLQSAVSSQDQNIVRLVGGPNRCSGRVEIFYIGQWGTVCDDGWDMNDAVVVCKQLGCGRAIAAYQKAKFGPGSGRIWLDDVECTGVESSLAECKTNQRGADNCVHLEDASVVCADEMGELSPIEQHNATVPEQRETVIEKKPSTDASAAGIGLKLVNGPGRCAGRVEIYHNDSWGTVCDDLWALNNAQVVCKQLGCGSAVSVLEGAFFGEGIGPIWLDNVYCTGKESSVTDCQAAPWGKHNCGHREDVGVVCSDEMAELSPTERHTSTVPEQRETVIEKKPSTNASADGMTELPPTERHTSTVPKQRETVIEKKPSTNASADQNIVRLVGGHNRCSGRVEIFYIGQWGTVCDDGWDMNDAAVVCKQLGCGRAIAAYQKAKFGPGSGRIWLDDVDCTGVESSLAECKTNQPGADNCVHLEDASVVCADEMGELSPIEHHNATVPEQADTVIEKKPSTDASADKFTESPSIERHRPTVPQEEEHTAEQKPSPASTADEFTESPSIERHRPTVPQEEEDTAEQKPSPASTADILRVRLADGPHRCAGRVEVYHNQQWGTVCDDTWSQLNAQVVCRELGCGSVVSYSEKYKPGNGPIWKDEVSCSGTESSLIQCNSEAWGSHNCGHNEDAGVHCQASSSQKETPSTWTERDTVAPDGWYMEPSTPAESTRANDLWEIVLTHPPPTISMPSDTSILQPSGVTQPRSPDVSTQLPADASSAPSPAVPTLPPKAPTHGLQSNRTEIKTDSLRVRLADGPHRCAGRVEVYYDHQWGTVCDDSWSKLDAQVVCRELGCGPVVSYSETYKPGDGRIWKDEVSCIGVEPSLIQCNSEAWGSHDCNHSEDAGVHCQVYTSTEETLANASVTPTVQAQASEQVTAARTSPLPKSTAMPVGSQSNFSHVQCTCETTVKTYESQQMSELVKIVREMREDFSSCTRPAQEGSQLKSLADSLKDIALSMRQLLEVVPMLLPQRSPGGAQQAQPCTSSGTPTQ